MSLSLRIHDSTKLLPSRSTAWRVTRLVLLGAVLGLTFLAYLSPDMQLQWENIAALCGF